MEHDILIPQPQADMLLREATEREVSAEELLAEIIKNSTPTSMPKSENISNGMKG